MSRRRLCPLSPPLTREVALAIQNGPGYFSPRRQCFISFEQKHKEAEQIMAFLDKLPPHLRKLIHELGMAVGIAAYNAERRAACLPKHKQKRRAPPALTLEDLGL